MKAVIITGTTSGLGFSLFNELLSENVRIVAMNRKPIHKDKNSPTIANLSMMTCDLSEINAENFDFPSSIFEGVSEVVFVMNAATVQPLNYAATLSLANLQKTFNVNYFAYVTLTQTLFRKCTDRNLTLRIVFITTGSIQRAIPGWAAYSASKGALLSFCKHLAIENRELKFETFDPGVFQSNIQDQIATFNSESFESQNNLALTDVLEVSLKLKSLILGGSQ